MDTTILIVGTVIGAIAGFIALIRYGLPIVIRSLLKPIIEMQVSLGNTKDIKYSISKQRPKLFTARESTIWLKSNKALDLENVTFRRICKYQKKCLLFRFFCKVNNIRNNWCSFASVDDWEYTDTFKRPESEYDRDICLQKFSENGELTLVPNINRMTNQSWITLDVPFMLRDKKLHLLEITLHVNLKSDDMPLLFKILSRIIEPISREIVYKYSINKIIKVDLSDKETKEIDKKEEESPNNQYKIAYSYAGISGIEKFNEHMTSLKKGIITFFKEQRSIKEIPAYEMRTLIKGQFPKVKASFRMPPSGIYKTTNKENIEFLLKHVWANGREICREFLDCESYSKLLSFFMNYFILFPFIFEYTYKYLILSSRNALVDVKLNISMRTKRLPIAMMQVLYNELRLMFLETRQKTRLRRETDRLAKSVNIG